MSESKREWIQQAPILSKMNPVQETYIYRTPLTKPVEDLDNINSATEKKVRSAADVKSENRSSGNKIALQWKCKLANQME